MAKKKGHYSKHPCIYIDDYNKPHLIIFRNFFIETQLPKFAKLDSETKVSIESNVIFNSDNIDTDASGLIPSWRRSTDSSSYGYERSMENSAKELHEKKQSILSKISTAFKSKNKAAVEDTFDKIKHGMYIPNTKDMEEALKTVEGLHKMMKDAGQYVQAEKIQNYGKVLTFELNLAKNGFQKYLLEEDIIDFMLKCKQGISITFLRYFSDILPVEVMKKKIEADKLKVFDNYAILYYDPKQQVFTWHEEEEDKRIARDPILFGMIEGSDKLYYICDWIYKDDDITMEKVEKITGRSAKFLRDAKIAETDIFVKDAISQLNSFIDQIRSVNEQ